MKNSKKIMVAAAVLAFAGMTSVNAETVKFNENSSIVLNIQDRTPIEEGALPDAVKTALAGDAYAGWTVKEAFSIQKADAVPYYSITLQNGDQTQTIDLNEAGQAVEASTNEASDIEVIPSEEPTATEQPTASEEPTTVESEPIQSDQKESAPTESATADITTE